MKPDEVAYNRVAKMLDAGMYQGNMHVCLRGAGRLAGGFIATGALKQGDVESLKQMAVARSIDKKLGAYTFTKAVDDGRKDPLALDDSQPESVKYGFDDELPRPKGRTVSRDAMTGDPSMPDKPAKKYATILDQSWVSSAELPPPPDGKHWQADEFKRYIKTMFEPGDIVGLNLDAWQREGDPRWLPGKGVWDRTAGELLAQVDKKKGDLSNVLGDGNAESGAWVRMNPLDGQGCDNANVATFRHALLEADEGDLGRQLQIIRQLQVPCSCIVHSGGKSIHALVRVDAANMEEYKQRVDYLYGVAQANGLKNDVACKNPSRLSRLPGFLRGDKKQYIIADRCGQEKWTDWVEWVEDQKDDLPNFESLGDMDFDDLPPLNQEIIGGILRKGHKMTLTGPSKGGKTWDLLELCAALACGGKWHGWKCTVERTLYVNLELDAISLKHRMRDVFVEQGIDFKYRKMIDVWNLRGKARPLDKLAPKLIRRAMKMGYSVIVIDPVYKILTGDENNASEMSLFTNLFDTISEQLHCAVVCCHHHSKGSQGAKRASDRGSGSGVFSRDPDAILDLVELLITPDARKQLFRLMGSKALVAASAAIGIDVVDKYGQDDAGNPDGLLLSLQMDFPAHAEEFRAALADANCAAVKMTGWRIECTLREFAKPDNAVCWFKFPIHMEDFTGMLKDMKAEGEEPAWEVQMRLRKEKKEQEKREKAALDKTRKDANAENAGEDSGDAELARAIESCGGIGVATLANVGKKLKRSDRTIRNRAVATKLYAVRDCIIHGVEKKEYAL